jgi:glucose-6-phosphate 1-dehydrogenase
MSSHQRATEMDPWAEPAPPCALVIFGAAGDLAKRLLVPSLYNLLCAKLLPKHFAIVGVARAGKDTETFRRDLGESLRKFSGAEVAPDKSRWLSDRADYLQGDFGDPGTYQRLGGALAEIGATRRTGGNVLFYLATPPDAFATIVTRLGKAGLVREESGSWRRVVVEKPFGTDLKSAQELDRKILSILAESQVYRIDHYLGKETVQNIMVFRFANGIYEPLWNRNHIDHIQITVAETVGVEQRGAFYDRTGALRDMVPNHLFQLLALTAMGAPNSLEADAVRWEKSKVLDAVRPFNRADCLEDVIRGQYGAGAIEGKPVAAYRQEPNVAQASTTETYVAMKLMLDNWRWAGVPFYLRTGKSLARRASEIAIKFKQAPLALFRGTPCETLTPNFLVLRIQPEEGISLQFGAKLPGAAMRIGSVTMDFDYKEHFKAVPSTGYETLIYDCMIGDATLFQRADNIELGWRVVQPILDAWQETPSPNLPNYGAGSAGPAEADALLARDGRRWRSIRPRPTT